MFMPMKTSWCHAYLLIVYTGFHLSPFLLEWFSWNIIWIHQNFPPVFTHRHFHWFPVSWRIRFNLINLVIKFFCALALGFPPSPVLAQSCLTLCYSMDYSPPGFSVHGIFQARILESVNISFFRRSSWPRDRTIVSCGWILYHCAIWEPPPPFCLHFNFNDNFCNFPTKQLLPLNCFHSWQVNLHINCLLTWYLLERGQKKRRGNLEEEGETSREKSCKHLKALSIS